MKMPTPERSKAEEVKPVSVHFFNVDTGGSRGRMMVTPKLRKHFPTCDCKTFEVHRYYDGSYIFHRKNCKWLWYQRKRKPRERLAWGTM